MSGSFPINIGVGKSMNIRFSVSSVAVAAGGVESIGVSLLPMVGDANQHGSPRGVDQPPNLAVKLTGLGPKMGPMLLKRSGAI